jgi:hypothetical protein
LSSNKIFAFSIDFAFAKIVLYAAVLLSSMVPLEGGPVREDSRSSRYGGGGGSTYGTAEELSIQLERGNTVVMQTGGALWKV